MSLILTKLSGTKNNTWSLQAQIAKSTVKTIHRSQEKSCKEKWVLCSLEIFQSRGVKTGSIFFDLCLSYFSSPCTMVPTASQFPLSTCNHCPEYITRLEQFSLGSPSSSNFLSICRIQGNDKVEINTTTYKQNSDDTKCPNLNTRFCATEVRIVFTLWWIVREWKGACASGCGEVVS